MGAWSVAAAPLGEAHYRVRAAANAAKAMHDRAIPQCDIVYPINDGITRHSGRNRETYLLASITQARGSTEARLSRAARQSKSEDRTRHDHQAD
jgi:hypothetical protein